MGPDLNLLVLGYGGYPWVDLLMVFLIDCLSERELLKSEGRNG